MIEERTLKKLEYFEILNKISQYTTSTTAKNKVSNLRPESALEKSLSLLDETEEAVNFLNFGVSPDFALDSTEDIAAKAKIRSTLSLRELLVVMRTLRTSRLLISTLNTPLPLPRIFCRTWQTVCMQTERWKRKSIFACSTKTSLTTKLPTPCFQFVKKSKKQMRK